MKLYFLLPLFLQKIVWIPTRFILNFFGDLEVRGLVNIKNIKSNVIFACNHTSELDPILLPASLPFFSKFSPIFYTSRESRFYQNSGWRKHFYGGWFFKIWGSYPVFTGLHDYSKSLIHHSRIVTAGGNLCFFPEGGITPNGKIQPAKGGVAYLAYATGVPIIPVYFEGAYSLTIRSFFLEGASLLVKFGRPIYPNKEFSDISTPKQFKMYADLVMKKIVELDK